MTDQFNLHLYQGNGEPITERGQQLPDFEPMNHFLHPKNYITGEGLSNAVNVALALGQPLLVTGEPGTGKTQLADSIAWELNIPKLEFNTKTTSTAVDLFYRYDSLLRFQEAQLPENKRMNIDRYITYEALGLAILLTKPPTEVNDYLPHELKGIGPKRSVVLIDEIDKAPRDLPNDVLNEIERMEFTVKETGTTHYAEKQFRPILVLTSNSEKNLPDAFLRRCVFYHIPFPQRSQLKEIVQKKFGRQSDFTSDFIDAAIDRFFQIRELKLKKPPATAEFLAWLRILRSLDLSAADLKSGQVEAFALSFSILAKGVDDFARLKREFAPR
ncbi:MAG: MoxR family ATPase [bacterium]|nr:MoxR family ATPase [bacterium]